MPLTSAYAPVPVLSDVHVTVRPSLWSKAAWAGKSGAGAANRVQHQETAVGAAARQVLEERRHFRLPAGVDVGGLHRVQRRVQVSCQEVAHQEAVVAQEEG